MPDFDPLRYAYPSHRNVVYARRAMACTSVPLGAELGLGVMRRGGNAVDAAVAMAAAMPLLEPTSNGVGSDCFALVWIERDRKLYGLNASGVAPMALSPEVFAKRGLNAVPRDGWLPTMVPGAPAGWAELNRRFGTKTLAELFEPAIAYAREGCPVPVEVGSLWGVSVRRFEQASEKDRAPYLEWFKAFTTPDGLPYRAGDVFRWEAFADTLEELAATECESLYRGALMEKLVAFSRETGGFFCGDDLRSYRPEWVEPIAADYKGYTVCEIPPNGHGITALMALNILKGLKLPGCRESADAYHAQLEAIKLAFEDAKAFVADPRYMKTKLADLLSEDYAARRRALIGERAILPTAGDPSSGGTVYLCTADPFGNMVSFIQSNYMGFGSGIVIPGTGISLQNRGANFSLDPNSDNCIAGGKKSYHTIIPGFLMKGGAAVGPFGVMGGFMQPQGHVQVIVNTVDYQMNPQECLDAPRMQWTLGRHVQLEREVPAHIAAELARRGHEIEILNSRSAMGRGQIIWRTDNGMLVGGTEPRCDGTAAAW
ncbi:MAG: gamma-glutamyltransferase family protein [Oscillospiraceae bacterium]|nr:gamma-glutamyltransferase family protein [Oscillospiraceae bacterium]